MGHGERIRQRRELLGIKQWELANQIGVQASALSRLENGKAQLTLEEAVKLAKALEMSLAELAGIEEIKPSPDDRLERAARISQRLRSLTEELEALAIH